MSDTTNDLRHVLVIDLWHPARLNQCDGTHGTKRHRLKKADRELIGVLARITEIPPATGRRRVSLRLTLAPRQRADDPDDYGKSALDVPVGAGLLIDFNRQGVELVAPPSAPQSKFAKEGLCEMTATSSSRLNRTTQRRAWPVRRVARTGLGTSGPHHLGLVLARE
jgi:hypothetical protein